MKLSTLVFNHRFKVHVSCLYSILSQMGDHILKPTHQIVFCNTYDREIVCACSIGLNKVNMNIELTNMTSQCSKSFWRMFELVSCMCSFVYRFETAKS